MRTLSILKTMAVSQPMQAEENPVLLHVDADEQVDAALNGLMDYFGENDNRLQVLLVTQGQPAGYLTREVMYDLVSFETKGIGDSDFSGLPGLPQYRLQQLHCPEPGCQYTLMVTYFQPDDAPHCKLHPMRIMEPLV